MQTFLLVLLAIGITTLMLVTWGSIGSAMCAFLLVIMVAAILYQLTRNLTPEEIKKAGMDTYFVDHTTGIYPIAASGVPMDMKYVGVKGDLIADLNEDLAAEQKARVTYDNILRLVDDPDVRDPIKYLRQRELVHYQRFGDALRVAQDRMDSKNFYAFNPSFDKK